MKRDVLDKWCERGILGLVLAILVFTPLAFGGVAQLPAGSVFDPVIRNPFGVVQGLALGVMLLWALRLWINPHPKLLWPPICWAVIAFAAYTIARYRTSELEYVARGEMIQVLVFGFLFLAILNNLHRQEHTQLIVFTLVFLAMALSFYALYQFLAGSRKVWMLTTPYEHRGTGTYISPNNLAGFLEMVLPLGLAWMLVSRAKPVLKVFVGYASLAILAGIAVTISRAAWLATGLTLLAFFGLLLFHRTYRLPAALALVVIVAAACYFIPRSHFFQRRLKELTVAGQLNDDVRFDLWEPAVKLWQEDVWFGIGPAHYNYRFRPYRPQWVQRQPDRVHNDYLNTLTDYGIVGAVLVLSAWVLLFAGVVKTWRFVRGSSGDLGGRNSNKFALVLGASAGLLAILVHSAADFNMHIPANALVAITLMAMLSGSLRFATEQHWHNARFWSKAVMTVILLAGLAYLGRQEIRHEKESRWLAKAASSSATRADQLAALEHAFAIEPTNFETAYAIGENLRSQAWDAADPEKLGKAMEWYKRTTSIDPYYGYGFLGCGLCLDRLDKESESWPDFDRAIKLDPNGYYTAAWVGWHYVQAGDYAAARDWFERSYRLSSDGNKIAHDYLEIVRKRMLEAASRPGPG